MERIKFFTGNAEEDADVKKAVSSLVQVAR